MPKSSNADFAEFASRALDAYQRDLRTEPGPHRHPWQPLEDELVADFLADLMHHCARNGIEFDEALDDARRVYINERADEGAYNLGSTVQLKGPAAQEAEAAGLPTRGVITGLLIAHDGSPDYYLRCPGEPRNHRFSAADLQPAPAFQAVTTHRGVVADPLAAERALVEATARIGTADGRDAPARYDDIEDHHTLLGSLSSWSGLSLERLSEILQPKFAAATRQLEAVAGRWEDGPPGVRPAGEPPGPAGLATQSFPARASEVSSTRADPGRDPSHQANDLTQYPRVAR
ncbi:hypothetical protein [Spirillospora sp. CA-294931]|uniref:hypothetical protein n=1 Tax=Spirillospora sp. CA-294931 TaxID=3240042 RepID=UPI003D94C2AA